ncbi:MAG: hypothetical protein QW796_04800 [Thermoproteota archaeon]
MLEVREPDSYRTHYPHVLDVEEGLGPRHQVWLRLPEAKGWSM